MISQGLRESVDGRVQEVMMEESGEKALELLSQYRPDVVVAVGDAATLFGGLVSLDEQATLAGTVSYELLAGLTARVTRRYTEGAA